MRQKGIQRRDGICGVTTLLAVLLTAIAVATFLDTPNTQAFPQNNSYDILPFYPEGFGDIVVADIDKDGNLDFVVSQRVSSPGEGTFSIWLQRPDVNDYDPIARIRVPSHKQMIVEDINLDGRHDVLILTESPESVMAFIQPVTGFQTPIIPSTVQTQTEAMNIAVGNLLGSQGLDLIVVNPNNVTIYQYGSGFPSYDSMRSQQLPGVSGYQRGIVTDLDDDGRQDLMLASPNQLKVYYGSSGTIDINCLSNCRTYPISGNLEGEITVLISDVTSDNLHDIVLSVTNKTTLCGTLVILKQDDNVPSWNFVELSRDKRDYTNQFILADFNGDERNDIAIILYSGGNIAFFYQEEGFFSLSRADFQINGVTASLNQLIVQGDFNRDNYQDIALRVWDDSKYQGIIYLFYQEDLPVNFGPSIPFQCPSNCFYFNQESSGDNLIDLSNYFHDDYGPIIYTIEYQEMPQNLSAWLDADGHHLDFTARSGWYGIAWFNISANDLYPGHEPIVSNNFAVMVNARPAIIGDAPLQVTIGEEYKYLPTIIDPFPTEDFHTFSIVEAPQGAFIDANSGLLKWRPNVIGNFTISLKTVDSFGATSEIKTFNVEVLPIPEEPPPNPIPLPDDPIEIASLGVILGAIIFLVTMVVVNENVKYSLLLLLIPLYTKIKREKVLDHFIRGQIYGYIMANPGEHYNAIKQALDITNGSLAHHLKTLEREKFIKSKRFGLYRRFYPWTMRIPEDGYFQINEIQRSILDLCRNQPGVSQKEIADSLNLTPPTINYHIAILAEHGYISVIRRGRKTQIFILKGGQNETH